uniref:CSON015354 protein n=1 Tax=Culicoides sonorensis TaxID=179676 RepID=A0A336MH99_CULSO
MKNFTAVIILTVCLSYALGQESDFEKRYGKYIRCKLTHKATDEELEIYNNADTICRQKAKHAFGADAGDDFHNKVSCVNHCVRNHTPSEYGDHTSYCVRVVDEGTYNEQSCKREL